MAFKLGLDTGGTYTDAVIIDEASRVVASAKSLTTHHDLGIGLTDVVGKIVSKIDEPVELVSLSTTLATNALVEGAEKQLL